MNKLLIKNTIISIVMFLSILLIILQNNYSLGGVFINNNYIYYLNLISLLLVIGIFIYKEVTKYDLILNINRLNKYTIHQFLNSLIYNNLLLTCLIYTKIINILIGIIILLLMNIFDLLLIILKYEENVTINSKIISIKNMIIMLLSLSIFINGLPFTQYFIPINMLLIALLGVIYVKQITNMIKIYFK